MRAYLDNAATTAADPLVLKEMLPYFTRKYGNASSLHSMGREASEAVEAARKRVSSLIGASPAEIIFTSGGTESDNLAIRGALARTGKKHIITTNIEHPAVLEVFKSLEAQGFTATYLKANQEGLVSPEQVSSAITRETALVSIMHANNEIGTIQPIAGIGKICRERDVIFHTDAVQSAGKVPLDVKRMGISLLSLSSHKLHGPKGVGALFVSQGIKLNPLFSGGGHESGIRPGTENVPGIAGFGKACQLSARGMEKNSARMKKLRDRLIRGLLRLEETHLNGSWEKRLPNNANLRFLGVEGESLLALLDDAGIYVSTGSACSSKKLEPSHVLLALGMPAWQAHGSLRLTLSRFTSAKEIDYAMEKLPPTVSRLRKMSPVWKRLKANEQIKEVWHERHLH